jgi:hypothetical protein
LIQAFSTVLDLRRLHRSESSSLDRLDSVRFLNLLAFVYKKLMSMGESHEHIRESTESLSASSLNPFHATFFINFLSPSASSLIQSFSVALNLRRFSSLIVVLIRLDSVRSRDSLASK